MADEIAVIYSSDQQADMYPIQSPGQPLLPNGKGFGLMDPIDVATRNGAEPWRFSTLLIGLGVSGGNLVLGGGAAASMFTVGLGGGAGQGYPTDLTEAETDALEKGALVKSGRSFVVRYVGIQLLRPFVFSGNTKVYSSWIDTYQRRIFETLAENMAIKITFDDSGCDYDLGTLAMWPQHATLSGVPGIPGIGAGIGSANLMTLRRPIVSGARDKEDKVKVTLKSGYASTIEADPLLPIPAGVTTVQCPVQSILYGYPTPANCDPCRIDLAGLLMAMPADARAAALASIRQLG